MTGTTTATLRAYQAWQFNGGGKALPMVQALVREARKAGIGERRLRETVIRRRKNGR